MQLVKRFNSIMRYIYNGLYVPFIHYARNVAFFEKINVGYILYTNNI